MTTAPSPAVSTTRPTLVLNGAGQPLGAIPLSRAVALTMTGRATALEVVGTLHSPSTTISAPTIIVRTEWTAAPTGPVGRVSRAALFARDSWQCGWCGRSIGDGGLRMEELTIDHLVPQARFRDSDRRGRRRGGFVAAAHRWDNVVTACRSCNGARGDEDPDYDALLFLPTTPTRLVIRSRLLSRLGRGEWDAYLPAAS